MITCTARSNLKRLASTTNWFGEGRFRAQSLEMQSRSSRRYGTLAWLHVHKPCKTKLCNALNEGEPPPAYAAAEHFLSRSAYL